MEDYAGSSNHFHYCSYLIKELVPLFVITALLLVAFMYMYHGQHSASMKALNVIILCSNGIWTIQLTNPS
jgi:hypothetical protein